jgi:hypothetical protein
LKEWGEIQSEKGEMRMNTAAEKKGRKEERIEKSKGFLSRHDNGST